MTLAQNIITIILLASGAFFLMVSSIGIIRLPDFYTRAHATGKSDTLGLMLTLAGLAVYNGLELSTIKLLIILLFVMIANPTATHAVTRAALRFGLSPWTANGNNNRREEVSKS
jgi:multicomponent Na+:H+ antiporter subunit G